MGLSSKEYPLKHMYIGEHGQEIKTYQFLGSKIRFAEATRQGSAYVGELRILRVYSFDEAMTINLRNATSANTFTQKNKSNGIHVENTEGTKVARVPLLLITLQSRVQTLREFTNYGDGPF